MPRSPAASTTSTAPPAPALHTASARLVVGLALIVAVFALGIVAQLAAIHRWGLSTVSDIAAEDRTPTVTTLASVLTSAATPEIVGIAALVLLPVACWLLHRRADAVRALCIIGGALALALVAKAFIAEPRPPQALWALPADSGNSYPSGHTTVAAVIVVVLAILVRSRTARVLIIVLGCLYAGGVAITRIYLADHYPLDVVGSALCALAGGFVVTGLAGLPPVARHLRRLDATAHRTAEMAPHT